MKDLKTYAKELAKLYGITLVENSVNPTIYDISNKISPICIADELAAIQRAKLEKTTIVEDNFVNPLISLLEANGDSFNYSTAINPYALAA